jgi:hypothetical protein
MSQPSGGPREAYLAIERFLETSREPVLMEPGEDPLPIGADNFQLNCSGQAVTLEAWGETRNLVRRVRAIHSEQRSRLEIEVERFGARTGLLMFIDMAHHSNGDALRRGARLKYRERFRRSLLRQFSGWRLAELSTETDLHHSLSPSYPRALLRKSATAWAAIGAAEDALDPDGSLTFGLIWLDYLRRREPGLAVQGLAVFLPAGKERTTCHRIRYLDPSIATYPVFLHHSDGSEEAVEPRDYTNFDTRVEPCLQPLAGSREQLRAWVERLAAVEGVERRDHSDGSVSLAVAGLEFARASGAQLAFGVDAQVHNAGEAQIAEIETLARGLKGMRNSAAHRQHPLYARHPEAWLESQVRLHIEQLDARLLARPLYGQVPQFAAGERGLLDVLAVDRDGRLAIVEVKAAQDVHLPLQALDYWMRVKWHLERGEFHARGYFPKVELREEPPRLLLVAPALDFHPSNETVLRYFSPEIEVERLGVGIEWRKELRVMFRNSSNAYPLSARSNARLRT